MGGAMHESSMSAGDSSTSPSEMDKVSRWKNGRYKTDLWCSVGVSPLSDSDTEIPTSAEMVLDVEPLEHEYHVKAHVYVRGLGSLQKELKLHEGTKKSYC